MIYKDIKRNVAFTSFISRLHRGYIKFVYRDNPKEPFTSRTREGIPACISVPVMWRSPGKEKRCKECLLDAQDRAFVREF